MRPGELPFARSGCQRPALRGDWTSPSDNRNAARGRFWRGKETTMTTTIETRIVRTAPGMEFDVSVAGDPGRPLVLMLHGFCVSRHYRESQVVALAEAGYFAAAPNQRGNAPGARPDPAEHANYMIDALIGDAMA